VENVPSIPIVEHFLGKYGWIILFGFIATIFKDTLQEVIAGLQIFLGNEYNNDDAVYVDGEPGRIVRVGKWKTTFYMYDYDKDGNISGGNALSIQNSELKHLRIARPLPKLEIPKKKKAPPSGG
jgi:hypothetical protein